MIVTDRDGFIFFGPFVRPSPRNAIDDSRQVLVIISVQNQITNRHSLTAEQN